MIFITVGFVNVSYTLCSTFRSIAGVCVQSVLWLPFRVTVFFFILVGRTCFPVFPTRISYISQG